LVIRQNLLKTAAEFAVFIYTKINNIMKIHINQRFQYWHSNCMYYLCEGRTVIENRDAYKNLGPLPISFDGVYKG